MANISIKVPLVKSQYKFYSKATRPAILSYIWRQADNMKFLSYLLSHHEDVNLSHLISYDLDFLDFIPFGKWAHG